MSDEPRASGQPVEIVASLDIAAARQRLDAAASRQTSTVTYVSGGHCLVIGEPDAALAAAAALEGAGVSGVTLAHVSAASGRVDKALTERGIALFTVPELRVGGHLGSFSAVAVASGAETDLAISVQRPGERFDLVLDLSPAPSIDVRLLPFGYVHAPGADDLAAAVESLAGLVGEFDKPRYFAYDASICAHSRSRLPGCSNCIDVCTTGAISSAGEGVAIDPYLCQGCGSCATLCPSGAMVYAYPKPSDAIARTRKAIGESGATTLVLHGEGARTAVDAAPLQASEVLTLLVEEVSAFGIDYWATVLAAGVGRILVVVDADDDGANPTGSIAGGQDADGTDPNGPLSTDRGRADPDRAALESQATLLRRLLAPLGLGPEIVQIVPPAVLVDIATLPGPSPALVGLAGSAAFATHDDKRQTLRMALDSLTGALAEPVALEADPLTPLPPGSPFGQVLVDTDACTLCMACVSTCPAGALLDGQDTPALRLIEANCLQCGLCERACPEDAIALESRWVRDGVEARRVRTLNEEAPFHCVVCHKAFATRAMIDTVLGKLSGHWMFGDDKARRRLKMCEDCRVKDIFDTDPDGLDVHAGPADGRRGGGSGGPLA